MSCAGPGCRTPYDDELATFRERREPASEPGKQPIAKKPVKPAVITLPRPFPTVPQPQQQTAAARSPPRALQDREWPSLAVAAPPAPTALPATTLTSRTASSVDSEDHRASHSSSSSACTGARTPPSPVSSVVAWRARPVPSDGAIVLQGHFQVSLRPPTLSVSPDPEGSKLVASLQGAVATGTLSAKHAAAAVIEHLRQRQQSEALGAAAVATTTTAAAAAGWGVPAGPALRRPIGLPPPGFGGVSQLSLFGGCA
jgi:hypothetical protein